MPHVVYGFLFNIARYTIYTPPFKKKFFLEYLLTKQKLKFISRYKKRPSFKDIAYNLCVCVILIGSSFQKLSARLKNNIRNVIKAESCDIICEMFIYIRIHMQFAFASLRGFRWVNLDARTAFHKTAMM